MPFLLYSAATALASPLLPFYLRARQRRGKEDALRLPERLGHSSRKRPDGQLLWVHAASVGEANSALPLIHRLRQEAPDWHILLTTGTVTSAGLMQKRLPMGAIHQFVPLDTPQAARRFIAHWRPQVALFVESELWPNLLREAYETGCRLLLVNARMSARSARRWGKLRGAVGRLLGWFDAIFAQTEADAQRFRALGASKVQYAGNLKYEGMELEAEGEALTALQFQTGERPLWLAASTHPGEERIAASVHRALSAAYPTLLTVIVPRHPQRGAEIKEELGRQFPALEVTLRSAETKIKPVTDIYVADTMGELGLFYRMSPVVFIGGSLVEHGGQNPLEPARLGCALLAGPHMFNFAEIVAGLRSAEALQQVEDEEALKKALKHLLSDTAHTAGMAARAAAWVTGKGGVSEHIVAYLKPALLAGESSHAA